MVVVVEPPAAVVVVVASFFFLDADASSEPQPAATSGGDAQRDSRESDPLGRDVHRASRASSERISRYHLTSASVR